MSEHSKCMFFKEEKCTHSEVEGKECDGIHEPPYCPVSLAHVEGHPREWPKDEMYQQKSGQTKLSTFLGGE